MRSKARAIVAAIAMLYSVAATAKVYLVTVGISDYPGNEMDLNLPVNDAKAVAEIYRLNAKRMGTTAAICQLTDTAATADNILHAIHKVFGKAEEGDITALYFSGHGLGRGFVAYDRLLAFDEVAAAVSQSQCHNKMIFADACYSGQISTLGENSVSTSAAQGVPDIGSYNVMLFLSSRSNEVSLERRDMKNGFFTSGLVYALKGGADYDRNRTVTAKELYNYVKQYVVKISEDKQHPKMWGNFSDNMPVIKW